MPTLTVIEGVTVNGKPLALLFCADCGVEDGEDLYPRHTADGYPALLAKVVADERVGDNVCAPCYDARSVFRFGTLAPCAAGLIGHSAGCGCS